MNKSRREQVAEDMANFLKNGGAVIQLKEGSKKGQDSASYLARLKDKALEGDELAAEKLEKIQQKESHLIFSRDERNSVG